MTRANIGDAKAQFSDLVKRAEAGEDVVILRAGKPVVRMIPVEKRRRPIGLDDHLGYSAEELDRPLPADVIEEFYK